MSQSLSWIDPSAFSAALSRAGFDPSRAAGRRLSPVWMPGLRPESRPDPTLSALGPGAAANPPAPVATTEAGALGSTRVEQAVPGPESPGPRPDVPELRLDSDRLDRRLESYMHWVEQCTSCEGLFIVDEEGLVLMERESDPNLVALSAYFLNLKDRIPDNLGTRSEGSIAIDLDDERVLHVVQADTQLGPHALGFTVDSPLHRDLTQSFQSSLSTVFAITD